MKIDRYGLYWANLDPVVGSEINKTRPVVIVSPDAMNRNLKTVVACPLTSAIHEDWRCRIQIEVKGKESEIAVDLIRTLSKQRLYDRIGKLTNDQSYQLRILISEMYGEPAN